MWGRLSECLLALWLASSPMVFGHGERFDGCVNDLACASLILLLALLSFLPPLSRAHLGNVVVALWLLALGYLGSEGHPPAPAAQNHVGVGLVLALFAIVPSRASEPPPAWRRWLQDQVTADAARRTR